jgi:hypothetical protein
MRATGRIPIAGRRRSARSKQFLQNLVSGPIARMGFALRLGSRLKPGLDHR